MRELQRTGFGRFMDDRMGLTGGCGSSDRSSSCVVIVNGFAVGFGLNALGVEMLWFFL